jgi:hypothetical protein
MLIVVDEQRRGLRARPARVWERGLAWARAGWAQQELARGRAAETSAVLAVRAQQLVTPKHLADLAEQLRALLADDTDPPPPSSVSLAVPYLDLGLAYALARPRRADRHQVRAAETQIQNLIDRLAAPGPVSVAGVAQVKMLLHDGAGPLYNPGSDRDLTSHLHQALRDIDDLG